MIVVDQVRLSQFKKEQCKSEFESYRSQLRNLILNPVEEPIFPEEPNPIWSKKNGKEERIMGKHSCEKRENKSRFS